LGAEIPGNIGNTPPWQRAADALHSRGAWRPVRVRRTDMFSKAVFSEKPPPIGNPEGKKGHRLRTKRKLARDR
jgi:hypothetical protein